jgi:hypothetical protein
MSNNEKTVITESYRKYQELCKLIYTVFEVNQDGKMVLEELKKEYLDKSFCPPGCAKGYGYYREGQAQVIWKLIEAIETHKQHCRGAV